MTQSANIDEMTYNRLQALANEAGLSPDAMLRHLIDQQQPGTDPFDSIYRTLAQNVRDLVYYIRLKPEMRFEYVSPSSTHIVGYTPEDHYADPLLGWKLVHPDDRPILETALGQAAESSLVLRWVRKDGQVIWTEQMNTPIYDLSGEMVALVGVARDISERMRAYAQLETTRDMLQRVFDSTHFLLAYLDTDFNFIRVNARYAAADDRDPDFFPGRNHFDLYPDAEAEAIFRRVVETGEPAIVESWPFTYAHNPERGTVYWDGSVRPVHDSEDQLEGLILILLDVTERVQIERKLRLQHGAIESTIVPIALADLEGKLTYVNPAFAALWRLPDANAALGRSVLSFWQSPEEAAQIVATIQEGGSTTGELTALRSDGTLADVLLTASVITNGDDRPIGMMGSFMDITERKQAQVRYKLLSDLTFEGIALHKGGMIVDVNPALLQMFGYERDELVGKQVIEVLFTPETRPIVYQKVGARQHEAYEVVGQRKDGSRFPVEIEARQVDDELRVAALRDISHRIQAQSYALENERLRASFVKEQEQNALIQRIISALSHDLRTPLTVISSAKDMLLHYHDRLSRERQIQKLQTIERQIHFALQLLEDTVQMARGSQQQPNFKPAPVNLAALCQVSVNEINSAMGRTHHLHFANLSGVEVAVVDEILVSRILINLLSNAVKYSPAGSEVRVELEAESGDWLLLRVIDEGIGIKADDLPLIFDPFFRATEAMTQTGTGLGLSIVRDCVQRHHGQVQVHSVLGAGTVISVRLPNRAATSDELAV